MSTRKGEQVIDTDEHPRADACVESLAKLKPVLAKQDPDATVTAGNSSGQNDAASMCLVTTEEKAAELGLTPLVRLVSWASAGVGPEVMGIGPVPATEVALRKADLQLSDIDVIELNEAFAAQALAVMREWKFTDADMQRTNVHGSGISLGHPVGATGGRMLATLARELHRRQARYGLETMCIGGGSGVGRRVRKGGTVTRLAQTLGLTEVQTEIISTVRQFVDKEIIPNAQELEHADTYPQAIVDQMREMGLFGLMIPEEYGGLGESLLTYALCVEEIARGWMSVSGVINTHFIVAYMIRQHGTDEQKQRFLPRMATGETRGAFSMSEPELRLRRRRDPHPGRRDDGDGTYTIDGQKMWLTNGGSSTLVAALVRTDEGADKPHRNLTAFLVEKPAGFGEVAPGLTIPGKIDKTRLQGHRHHRDGLRRLRHRRRRRPRRRAGPGLLPDDGRRRGRPRQRRRPRLRCGHPRVRARGRATPSSAAPSASRSPSTRPSPSSSPRWPPKSKRHI